MRIKRNGPLINSYSSTEAPECSHNGLNKYLSWDHEKGKYCCQSEPDSNQKIFEKLHDEMYHLFHGISLTRCNFEMYEPMLQKYLNVFKLTHTKEEWRAEVNRLNDAVEFTQTRSACELPDRKIGRTERTQRLSAALANKMPEWSGAPLTVAEAFESLKKTPDAGGSKRTRVKRSRTRVKRSRTRVKRSCKLHHQ